MRVRRFLAMLLGLAGAGLSLLCGTPSGAAQDESPPASTIAVLQWIHITDTVGPAVVSGSHVAWVSTPDQVVHMYDLTTGADTVLDGSHQDDNRSLALAGGLLVWSDDRSGLPTIYGYNLATGTQAPLSPSSGAQTLPATNGWFVVWQDERSGHDEIYGFDTRTGAEVPVATGPDVTRWPGVNDQVIWWRGPRPFGWRSLGPVLGPVQVWTAPLPRDFVGLSPTAWQGSVMLLQAKANCCALQDELVLYDTATGQETLVTSDGAELVYGPLAPLSDRWVVYQHPVNMVKRGYSVTESWAYDRQTGQSLELSPAPSGQPVVSGNTAVVVSNAGIDLAVLGDASTSDAQEGDLQLPWDHAASLVGRK